MTNEQKIIEKAIQEEKIELTLDQVDAICAIIEAGRKINNFYDLDNYDTI